MSVSFFQEKSLALFKDLITGSGLSHEAIIALAERMEKIGPSGLAVEHVKSQNPKTGETPVHTLRFKSNGWHYERETVARGALSDEELQQEQDRFVQLYYYGKFGAYPAIGFAKALGVEITYKADFKSQA